MVLGEGSWGKGGERSIRGSGEERKIDTLPSPSVPDTAHVAAPILCCPSAGRPTNPALNHQTGTGGGGDRGGDPAAFFRKGFLSTHGAFIEALLTSKVRRRARIPREAWAGKTKWKNPKSEKERQTEASC